MKRLASEPSDKRSTYVKNTKKANRNKGSVLLAFPGNVPGVSRAALGRKLLREREPQSVY